MAEHHQVILREAYTLVFFKVRYFEHGGNDHVGHQAHVMGIKFVHVMPLSSPYPFF